ncbi:cytochrome c oxidase assembly protein Cox18p, mitochondrial [Monosporozyma unispora]|nr:Cytochrome c oxidase assembly protein cox18, mitochondrial [Kazachstania unispora]
MFARRPIINQYRLIPKSILSLNRTTPSRTFITNQIADLFTTTHELTGIPWVVLIPLTTVTLRTVFTLPISIMQRKRIVKQQELRKISTSSTPIIKSRLALLVNDKGNKTKLTPDQIQLLAMKETRKRQKLLFKLYNIPLWKNVMLPLVQIPLWTTLSLSIRNLTSLEIERSTKQWFESFNWNGIDLTGPLLDYPMIIPLTLGALSIMNVEYNGKMISRRNTDNVGIEVYRDDQSRINQAMKSILNISRIGCIFMMGVSSQSAVLLSLYWISSQLYSLIQNIILDKMWPYQR